MDSDFISTDIRYRDRMLAPKQKSKRRSASSFFVPEVSSAKSVGGCSGGAKPKTVTKPVLTSSVSVNVGGNEVDVIGGDSEGNLYIGCGGAVAKVESGEVDVTSVRRTV